MTEHDEGSDTDGIIDEIATQLQAQFKELMHIDADAYPRRQWLHGDVNCRCVLVWESPERVTVHVALECRLHGVGTETLDYLRQVEAKQVSEPGVDSKYDYACNRQDVAVDLAKTIQPITWKSVGRIPDEQR